MIRIVADTNIDVSAVMFGGLPGSVLDLGVTQVITLVISPALLDELEEKLRVKFEISAESATSIRRKLESAADVVDPDIVLDLVAEDPDDNRVLECAVSGRADYIVSGDRHLLRLKEYEGIRILKARGFLNAMEGKD